VLRTSGPLARRRPIERLSLSEAADDQRRRGEWCTFRLPILAQYWAAGITAAIE